MNLGCLKTIDLQGTGTPLPSQKFTQLPFNTATQE